MSTIDEIPKKYKKECLRCGNVWLNKLPHPKVCPACNNRLWNKPRKGKRGRPKRKELKNSA